jgi:hypothetical protein
MKRTGIITVFLALFLISGCTKAVKSISLDKVDLTVEHGNTFVLTAAIAPDDAGDKTVTWSVGTENVSAVTNENTLQKEFLASKVGRAGVKVVSANGLEAGCSVIVTENAEDKATRKAAEAEAKAAREQAAAEAKAAKEKADAEEKAAAEQKAAEAAEKERNKYNTGITYEQLSRTPDKYEGEYVKFRGKVIQVLEGDTEIQLRVAVNSNYDTILFVEYSPSIVSSRILEDDVVTLYGKSLGTITYKSTNGGPITIPAVLVDKFDQ